MVNVYYFWIIIQKSLHLLLKFTCNIVFCSYLIKQLLPKLSCTQVTSAKKFSRTSQPNFTRTIAQTAVWGKDTDHCETSYQARNFKMTSAVKKMNSPQSWKVYVTNFMKTNLMKLFLYTGYIFITLLDDNLFFLKQNSHVLMSTFKT